MSLVTERMNPRELRAAVSLASIYALRMLGLFLILPVFAVHAQGMPGANPALIGLALGIYGLTQAVLQIPFGVASDRWGRKPVIVVGLITMALGSFVAAFASTLEWITIGRALQGMGAVSAAVSAFMADSTRPSQRTKAMAMVGASISVMFALSMVVAPPLYAAIGMDGLFTLTAVLALIAVTVVLWAVPSAPAQLAHGTGRTHWTRVVFHRQLLRLNGGIFALHAAMMALFVVMPVLLVERGLPLSQHAWVYLPVMLLSFVFMMPPIRMAERRGQVRWLMRGAMGLLLLSALGFVWAAWDTRLSVVWLAVCLTLFFIAFNVLEASLPSATSRFAPADARGLALGVYNTCHSLAFYVGGTVGGWLVAHHGAQAVFIAMAVVALLWLGASVGLREPTEAPGAYVAQDPQAALEEKIVI